MTETQRDFDVRLGSGGDAVYAALVEAHRGLSDDQSARLNIRLILLLANQLGDADAVCAAIANARKGTATS